MADLIICSTPYQIFSAINLKESGVLSDVCDVLIFRYFSGAEDIANRLRKCGLFRDIYVRDTRQTLKRATTGRYKRYLWNSIYYLRSGIIAKRLLDGRKYDNVFYSFIDPNVTYLAHYWSRNNNSINYIAFEDGLSDYYNDLHGTHYARPRWARWFGVPQEVYYRKKIYLYYPQIAPNPMQKYITCQIEKVFFDDTVKGIINSVFSWETGDQISERLIYFDQLPHDRVGATDDFNINVIQSIQKHWGNEVIVKLHPRREKNIYSYCKAKVYKNSSIPFEVCCLNSNCENKIFITNISSACFMPKMIFDYEPIIIFLYQIEHQNNDQPVIEFIERFKKEYKDSKKIYFPQSIAELNEILEKLQRGG